MELLGITSEIKSYFSLNAIKIKYLYPQTKARGKNYFDYVSA